MTDPADSHQIDQQYPPFKPFADWQGAKFDTSRWDSMKSRINAFKSSGPAVLQRAEMIARRAAAFESGAIEDLYQTDRGITMTIARETAGWEQVINNTGASEIVRDQLETYEGLLDLATGRVPPTEAGIRELHVRLCKSQKTYLVQTSVGPQKQTLKHGQYKDHPNHVIRADGTCHAYAPVDLVSSEMHRLVQELQTDVFQSAHSVLQAAYAHHAFVTVHPFADGNGRVSRAIASVFLYRDARIPFLFFFDKRQDYYEALFAADAGDYGPWTNFVFEAGLQTMLLVEESLSRADYAKASDSLNAIKALYVTKSGFTHEEIDEGAENLADAVVVECKVRLAGALKGIGIDHTHSAELTSGGKSPKKEEYRDLMKGKQRVLIRASIEQPPARASSHISLVIRVPTNPDSGDSILLIDNSDGTERLFEARVDEVIPTLSTSIATRIAMLAEGLVNQLLNELAKLSAVNARKA